jgi:general secretion pathway protein D
MMNNPLDMILDKTRMNQVMASKKLRLSIRGYLQAAMLGAALSAVLPVQVYAADEDLVAAEPSVLGIAEGERVIEPVTALANPTPVPAKALRNKPVAYKPALPKKATNTGENAIISKLEFKQANMVDVVRALADMSGLNIVATDEAAKKTVTVFLQNISVKDALDTISKNSGLWYRQDKTSKTFRIMSTEEYQRDMVVYREDTTRVFNLLHPNPVMVATAVRDLYGNRVRLTYGVEPETFVTGGVGQGVGGNRNQTGVNNNRNQNGAGAMGNGQANMRQTTANGNRNVTNNNAGAGAVAGAAGQSNAITEKLTADQLQKMDAAIQVDDDGNIISSNVLKDITRSEQPIFITLNREHNLMIVRTSDAAAVKEIENLVKEMDKPTPQVLLEMKVLELTVGDSFSQLFSFSSISKDGKHGLDAPVSDIPLGGLNSGKLVYTFVDSLIAARIELLKKDKKINTLSSPVLMASNNRPASLFVGEERLLIRGVTVTDPVLGGANNNVITPAKITYETEIRNVGNSLNIKPKINADGTVTLAILQDTSTVNVGGMQFPPITVGNTTQTFAIDSVNTANIEAVVVAKDGLTVAIGGLIKTKNGKDVRKVPILGDIPILGKLFQDREEFNDKTELILLITPHIIANPTESEDVTRDAVEPISEQEW